MLYQLFNQNFSDEKNFGGLFVDIVPCIRVLIVMKFKQILFIMTFINIQRKFSQQLWGWFSPWRTLSKTSHFWKIIWLKIIFSVRFIIIPFRKIKNFVKIISFRCSNSYFSPTRSPSFPDKVSCENLFFAEQDSTEKRSVLIHASDMCPPTIS